MTHDQGQRCARMKISAIHVQITAANARIVDLHKHLRRRHLRTGHVLPFKVSVVCKH